MYRIGAISSAAITMLGLILMATPSLEGFVPTLAVQESGVKGSEAAGKAPGHGVQWYVGVICIIWYCTVLSLAYSGWIEIMRKFTQMKQLPDPKLAQEPVSIIRPCKGIDTEMTACLESCILQVYPRDRFEVLFCVESPEDPSIPIIKDVMRRHPDYDLKLLVGWAGREDHYGPNPKINNLSKAYRHAKHDIVWVLDSNVWSSPGTLARSVESLVHSLDNGAKTRGRPVVLTHQAPLAFSVGEETRALPLSARLDEMFLFSSHAKFYVGFNKVSIAPCVNGKSNFYRRSALDLAVERIGEATRATALFRDPQIQRDARAIALKNHGRVAHEHCGFTEVTLARGGLEPRAGLEPRSGLEDRAGFDERAVAGPDQPHHHGIEFFSTYIGEDNMIGTALWDMLGGRTGMTRDVVVQPLRFGTSDDGLRNYIDRRVRWLRVRKYMVLAATLLEPTTESLVSGAMGAYGISRVFGASFYVVFGLHCALWCATDWAQYCALLRCVYSDIALENENEPEFVAAARPRRRFATWLGVWLLREALALPIWVRAMCGSVIYWRNKPFKINRDLTAEELRPQLRPRSPPRTPTN
ncbi:LAFE_0F03774g1_1 [Lachancea fermentati]|uniref:Ceramide glucosyltransferase n=1 Tax=Lachancea fermentati TaxID=4955 RepID=A0A1G4MEN8_LACFM|nr:LAFE_0F03774g1_1 [Lachancea fermentati]